MNVALFLVLIAFFVLLGDEAVSLCNRSRQVRLEERFPELLVGYRGQLARGDVEHRSAAPFAALAHAHGGSGVGGQDRAGKFRVRRHIDMIFDQVRMVPVGTGSTGPDHGTAMRHAAMVPVELLLRHEGDGRIVAGEIPGHRLHSSFDFVSVRSVFRDNEAGSDVLFAGRKNRIFEAADAGERAFDYGDRKSVV